MLEYYPIDFTKESFTFQDTEPFKSITTNNVFKSSIDKMVDLLNVPFTNANIDGDAIIDSDNIIKQYDDIFNNFKNITIKFNHPNDKLTKTICCLDDADVVNNLNKISTAIQELVKSCNDKGTNNKIKCNGIKPFEAEAFKGQVKNIGELIKNSFIVNPPDKINNNNNNFDTDLVYDDITIMVGIINSESTTLNILTIENIKLINSLIADLVTKINELGPYDNNSYIRLFAIVKQLINIKNTLSTLNINIYTGVAPLDEIFEICKNYAKNPDTGDNSHIINFPDTLPNNDADLNYYRNCNISTYKHIVPNSLWYYYVNTDAGRKNSKWVKNNLKFSEFRLDDTSNRYENFNGKKSSWSIHTKEDWKTNAFTKYIKITKINIIILIVLILISLITLTISYNKQISGVIIIITVLQMFRVIKLILGNGKLKESDFTENIVYKPPINSILNNYTDIVSSNPAKPSRYYNNIQGKAKLFPRVFNKLYFYDITHVKTQLVKNDYDNIHKKLVKKYNSFLAFLIILILSVIAIIVTFFYNLLEIKLVIPVLILNIITILIYIRYSKKFNDILPLELQTNKNISLPMSVYCNLDANTIPQ